MTKEKIIQNPTSNELVISKTISKDINAALFNRVSSFETTDQYIDYVIDLEMSLNGTNQIINGYETAETYLDNKENLSKDKIVEETQSILNEVVELVSSIANLEPDNVKESGYDATTGLMFIPEDNVIQYVKMQLDKVVGLVNILKEKK